METTTNDVKSFYWFDLTISEVALVTHTLYRDLENRYNTVQIIIQAKENAYNKYTLIAICSIRHMSKRELMKYMERIPDNGVVKT